MMVKFSKEFIIKTKLTYYQKKYKYFFKVLSLKNVVSIKKLKTEIETTSHKINMLIDSNILMLD